MREWIDLHDQLERLLGSREGFIDNQVDASYEQIHVSLLAGFLRNIATKKQGQVYQGAHNKELMIFPGSHQFMKGGQWLVAASFIETTRLYALTVATIEPAWIERGSRPSLQIFVVQSALAEKNRPGYRRRNGFTVRSYHRNRQKSQLRQKKRQKHCRSPRYFHPVGARLGRTQRQLRLS